MSDRCLNFPCALDNGHDGTCQTHPRELRVLLGCESSGIEREACLAQGHDAYSCDLLPADDGSRRHFQKDVLACMRDDGPWDYIICHPTCTYLTNAGVRWLYADDDENPRCLKGAPRWAAMKAGADFFSDCVTYARKYARLGSAIENPVMHKHARMWCGEFSFSVQPWQFGDPAFKRICWWTDRLPALQPTRVLTPPKAGTQEHKQWSAVHRAPPGESRWKIRSKSFPGIAHAIATQWIGSIGYQNGVDAAAGGLTQRPL